MYNLNSELLCLSALILWQLRQLGEKYWNKDTRRRCFSSHLMAGVASLLQLECTLYLAMEQCIRVYSWVVPTLLRELTGADLHQISGLVISLPGYGKEQRSTLSKPLTLITKRGLSNLVCQIGFSKEEVM